MNGPLHLGANTGANPLPSYFDSLFQTLSPTLNLTTSLSGPSFFFPINSRKLGTPQLQAEKKAALAQVKRLQNQQSASTSFLQRTAADVQNTATSAANQNSHLATHVDTQLDEIKTPILGAQTKADQNFQRIHTNINYLYNRGKQWHDAYERRFASIEERLGELELRPLMPQPESPQPLHIQLKRRISSSFLHLLHLHLHLVPAVIMAVFPVKWAHVMPFVVVV